MSFDRYFEYWTARVAGVVVEFCEAVTANVPTAAVLGKKLTSITVNNL